jgi:hypothetical protein
MLLVLFEQALHFFVEAEKIRPAGNDDAILRGNRCVRLLQNPTYVWDVWEQERSVRCPGHAADIDTFEASPPHRNCIEQGRA